MKINNFLFAAAITAAALTSSCEKGPTPETELTSTVKFSSKITNHVITKAVNDVWENNDAIGVFMKGGSGFTNLLASNKKYVTTNTSGNFQGESAAEEINYPADGSTVDFVAYYPYQAAVANQVLALNLADQSQQNKIDLMYANNATNLSKSTSNAQLIFNHALSKVELTVQKGTGVSSLANLAVQLDGFNTSANFDLATGTLANADAKKVFNAKVTTGTDKSVAEAIVLPVASAAGNKIVFKLAEGDFTWTLPTPTSYEAGKKYVYAITLTTDASGSNNVSVTSTIVDWTNVPSGSYNIIKDGIEETPVTNPTDPTEQVLFTEDFGATAVSASTKIALFTGWSSTGLTFSDSFASADVRTIKSNTTNGNHVWLPANKDAQLAIANINTKGASKLKLKLQVAVNVFKEGQSFDIKDIAFNLNGVVYNLASRTLTFENKDANVFYDVEVDFAAAKDLPETSTLVISTATATNTVGVRIDNLSLSGLK